MRHLWFWSFTGLCGTAVAVRNPQAERLLQRLHGRVGNKLEVDARYKVPKEPTIRARADSKPRFLNEATSKFSVNGTGIPEVSFDVGESYAGQLPISGKTDERDHLYFWFFPTANEEHKDTKEIVIWLNGGPGCSSILGLAQENSPFLWPVGKLKPEANPWSWHQLTNVVWIEQPVTVGFSEGEATIKDEDGLADQFLGFWKSFVDTFKLHDWKVFVATESYGGYYGPYISSHMVDANDTRYFNLGGLMVYDGVMFDDIIQTNVPAGSFMEQHYELMPLGEPGRQQANNISE